MAAIKYLEIIKTPGRSQELDWGLGREDWVLGGRGPVILQEEGEDWVLGRRGPVIIQEEGEDWVL